MALSCQMLYKSSRPLLHFIEAQFLQNTTRSFTDFFDEKKEVSHVGDVSFPDLLGTDDKIPLGRMRFVTVQTFMNKKYINIREYFEKDGETIPTKNGITLRMAEWRKLKESLDLIEEKIQSIEFDEEG